MSVSLISLLNTELSKLTINGGESLNEGGDFAKRVVEKAQKRNIDLHSIPELKYADLNGDGKIEAFEIATLISAAHYKRTGSDNMIVSSGNGYIDGRSVPNPNFDPRIIATDIQNMTNADIVQKAKLALKGYIDFDALFAPYNEQFNDTSKLVEKDHLNDSPPKAPPANGYKKPQRSIQR